MLARRVWAKREILGMYLEGTPVEGDEGQLRRLMELPNTVDRVGVVVTIAAGEAGSVDEALENRWCEDLIEDVRRLIDDP